MPDANFQTIRVEVEGPVCSIFLNKPPLNIIDFTMIQELRSALEQIDGNSGTRAIVLRGAGEKGFSAGVSVQDHTPERVASMIPAFDDLFRLLLRTVKVTIAAVHGFCLGGGFELVQACDLVLATDNAQFGQPEIKLGQLAPIGVILLPQLVGYRKATELLLTGVSISAQDAQSLGLVNRVAPPGEFPQAVEKLLGEITSQSASILRLTKRALRFTGVLDFHKAIKKTEDFFFDSVLPTEDAKEGIFAFLEKRAPHWAHS